MNNWTFIFALSCCLTSNTIVGQEINNELQDLLNQDYELIYKKNKIPRIIFTEIKMLTDEKFKLADPGKNYNSTDVANPFLKDRRLSLALKSQNKWAIFYEHGGRGHHNHGFIATIGPDNIYIASFYTSPINSIDQLSEAIASGDIIQSEGDDKF